jgi:hypothetical protein
MKPGEKEVQKQVPNRMRAHVKRKATSITAHVITTVTLPTFSATFSSLAIVTVQRPI